MSCGAHPPLAELEALLWCQRCHACKLDGRLIKAGTDDAYLLHDASARAIRFSQLADVALIGKRIRVTIEELPELPELAEAPPPEPV